MSEDYPASAVLSEVFSALEDMVDGGYVAMSPDDVADENFMEIVRNCKSKGVYMVISKEDGLVRFAYRLSYIPVCDDV